MNSTPTIAIVGRPNVGKSTLFNKLVGKRIAIVEDSPGVTRDSIFAEAEWCGQELMLIDTGGIFSADMGNKSAEFTAEIKQAVDAAMSVADCILFVTDGREGLNPNDMEIARIIRRLKKPVVLVVNKLDNNDQTKLLEFWELGLGEPISTSAIGSMGLGDVLEGVVDATKKDVEVTTSEPSEILNIAIVGKPNAGKSSIVNKLLGYDRVIVSNIAGTTRDAIDTPFEYNGQKFNLIDTAGIRKKARIDERLETYSVMRALAAIKRADIVLLVLDATEHADEQFVRIAGYADKEGKPSLVVVNKWDLLEKDTNTAHKFTQHLLTELKFMAYLQTLYTSALTGQRVNQIIDRALEVHKEASKRVPTSILNDILRDAIIRTEPPVKEGKRLKIYYATQPETNPPTFVLSVNDKKHLHFSYERYLENCLRDTFGFKGTPIRIFYKSKVGLGE